MISIGGRLGGAVAPFLTMFLILNIGGWRLTLGLYGVLGRCCNHLLLGCSR